MTEHTYKIVEITGSSTEGSDQAIRNAINKASETITNLDWFEVLETRGNIKDNSIAYWQVTIKIGFRLDD
jgi:flavin-binding protein dodecin